MTQDDAVVEAPHVSRGRAWLRRLALMVIAMFAAYVIIQLVGQIDWGEVRDALGHLAWWQLIVLVVPLFVRQVLNSLPLVFFIKGLSVYHAIVNDLSAHLVVVVAPPPGDMVIRVAMFTSWGIEAARGIAGTLMNMLSFYVMRFSVPVLGVLILLPVRWDSGYAVTAALSAVVALTIVALIVLGLRSETFAEKLGRNAGTVAAKVRKSVSPEGWAGAVVGFRHDLTGTFPAGVPRSGAALVALVFADATVLLMALRFVDLPASELPAIEVYAAFLCAYPLTLFPFMGLGIMDATLVGTFVAVAGLDAEPAAVAALVVYRAYTLAGPILLGAVSLGLWKHSTRSPS